MKQKTGRDKSPAEQVIKDIRRVTRRIHGNLFVKGLQPESACRLQQWLETAN